MTNRDTLVSPTLGSILLGSRDPDRLLAWYGAALEAEPNPDGFLDFGGVSVLIDRRTDVAAQSLEPGRLILNFHVDDARSTAAHLDRLGASRLVELADRGDGLFGTLVDPDGNYIQIIQLSEEYHASRGR